MRVLRNLSISLITAVGSCVLGFLVADYITRLLEVSDFEGGRGYAVLFFGGGFGILVGVVTGLVAGLLTRRSGLTGFLRAQGLAFLIILLLAGAITGIPWLLSDKPPRIDGKRLMLDFELSVPSSIEIPTEPSGYYIHATLYLGNKASRSAFIDWKGIARGSDRTIIPGRISLLTHSPNRSLYTSVENEPLHSHFFTLKLLPAPTKNDEAWSGWVAPEKTEESGPLPQADDFLLRYRVRLFEGN